MEILRLGKWGVQDYVSCRLDNCRKSAEQKLQTALHAKAKESPNLRFHALYDKVYRKDVLAYAYERCKPTAGLREWTARHSRTSKHTAGNGG